MDAKRSVVGPNHKKNAIVRDKGIVKCGKVNVSTLTWENRSKKSMSQSAMSFGVDTNKELKDRASVSGVVPIIYRKIFIVTLKSILQDQKDQQCQPRAKKKKVRV